MATQEFMNVRQTATALGVHENTVRNLERRGVLAALRLPGSGFRRFRKEDVERMRADMFREFAPATQVDEERADRPQRATAKTA